MIKKLKRLLTLCICCVFSAQAQNSLNKSLAFPGAEGYGKYTTGGRGGKVLIVSNLKDSGQGSLRDAINEKGPRIIVFSVSGTIHLESALEIKGDLTIAGQSAPGDGICLADYPVKLNGNNIILRYLRFRMGDRFQNKGKVDGGGGDDAFGGLRRKNIVIDHCSMSWSTDEVFSVYAGDSTSIQWNLISEPLNYSYHFETGDTDFERHGFGGIWGGRHLSAHHNLFAHCNSRTPRFDGIRNSDIENVDFRNNVIYNWGSNNVYAGEGGNYNVVNNYYKYGPETKKSVIDRIVNPYKTAKIPFGKFYVNGNFVDGSAEVTSNNHKGVHMENGNKEDLERALMPGAFPSTEINFQTATQAYTSVLKSVGASFKRDTLDRRIIKNVKTRTGKIIDVQGANLHGTAYEVSKAAWPALKSSKPQVDTDSDGIPDVWEKKNKLNFKDSSDANKYKLSKIYTNIEVYLNSLLKNSH